MAKFRSAVARSKLKMTVTYRVFIKYCVFPENVVIFLNSASSVAALVFYLPGVCTHTDAESKQREARVRDIIFEKTEYLMNILYMQNLCGEKLYFDQIFMTNQA